MKIVHVYNDQLISVLNRLSEDDVIEWFKVNTIDWGVDENIPTN